MRDVVAAKILHGWLQNRHQVLLPLTVNFRRLGESDARLLVETMAMACLAGASGPVHGRAAARRFIEQCGGSDTLVEAFERALKDPPAFNTILHRVHAARDLAAFSYIVATVVTDSRDPTDQLFLQWMAAKLDLPNTVKRSVERRYRS